MIGTQLLKSTSFVVVGFVIGLLVTIFGFVFIFLNEPPTNARSLGASNADSGMLPTSIPNSTSAEISLTSVEDIEQELRSKGPFQRTLTLHNFLSTAKAKEHGDLVQMAENVRPSTLRDEIQETVVRRLSLLEPKIVVSILEQIPEIRRQALLEVAFMEMAIADLDQATALAKTLDATQRQSALRGILLGNKTVPLDRLREIAAELGDEQAAIDSIALSRISAGVDAPFTTWVKLLNEYDDDIKSLSQAQIQLLVHVAKVWTEKSGMDAIQPIYSTLPSDGIRITVMSNLLQELNESSPELVLEAAQWIKVKDLEVLAEAFADWAETNPLVALEVATAFEVSYQRLRIQRSVLKGWIRSDPNSLLEEMNQIPANLQNWGRQEALLSMTHTTPELVPAWLQGVEEKLSREIVIGNVIYNWVEHDPKGVLQWVKTDEQAQQLLPQFIDDILGNLAHVDPSLALELALEQPIHPAETGLEALVIAETTRVDIERGIAMLENARNQVTLEASQVGVGIALVRQGEIDRVLELSTTLSDEFREQFFFELAHPWAMRHPVSLLEHLDSLPSDAVRENSIRVLLMANRLTNALSNAQLDTLKNFRGD